MTDIRAITIKRPWAGLIAHHGKNIENRSWSTAYRGTLLIHAGAGWDDSAEWWWITGSDVPDLPEACWGRKKNPAGVVAVANLVGVCPGRPCGCGPWAMDESRHFQLADVRALPEPVPARGALGLWRPTDDVVAAVMAGGQS